MLGSYQLRLTGESFYDRAVVTLAYQDIEESRHNRGFGGSNRTSRIENVNVLTLNADLSKTVGVKNHLNYGVEVTHNTVELEAHRTNVNTDEITPASTRYPDGGSTMLTAAAYVANRMNLTERLLLNAGLRFTYNDLQATFDNKDFFPFPYDEANQQSSALSGNLGLTFKASEKLKVSVLGSTGFRTPNVDDLAKVFESASGTLVVPNPDLKPEYVYNGELNVDILPTETVQLNAAVFYTLIDNAITTSPFTLNGADSVDYDGELSAVFASQNNSTGTIFGTSLSAGVNFTDALRLLGTFNYTRGRVQPPNDAEEVPLDHVAPIFGKVSLAYTKPKWQAAFWVLYNGAKQLEDYSPSGEDNLQYATPEGMPAWMTLNLRAGYHITDNFMVQAGVENILDTSYRVFASGISAPGRNFFATLRANF